MEVSFNFIRIFIFVFIYFSKLGLLWAATGNQVDSISGHLKKHNIDHEVLPGTKVN